MLFVPSFIVASLSSLIQIGCWTLMPISSRTIMTHITSFRAADNARYSASVVLCADTPGCNFDLYDRRFPLRVMKNPVRDRLVLGHDACDASTQTSMIHGSFRVFPAILRAEFRSRRS